MNEDAILRAAFGHAAAVPRLLSLLPGDASAGLEGGRLRRLVAEQVARGGRKRVGDLAWAVGVEGDPDTEAMLAVECQSSPDWRMALRMLVYAGLLWQSLAETPRYQRRQLPPALLVLVYTGAGNWRPKMLRELLRDSPPSLGRRRPDFDFEFLDAKALTADDANANWLAALLRLLCCRDPASLPVRSKTLSDTLRHDGLDDLASILAELLMRMLIFRFAGRGAEQHDDHLRLALTYMGEPTMLEQAITEWREAALAEGQAKGHAEGHAEGRVEERAQSVARERAILSRQAARRFGSEAGDAFAALLANEEDIVRLGTMSDLVVDCADSDELLQRSRSVLVNADSP